MKPDQTSKHSVSVKKLKFNYSIRYLTAEKSKFLLFADSGFVFTTIFSYLSSTPEINALAKTLQDTTERNLR